MSRSWRHIATTCSYRRREDRSIRCATSSPKMVCFPDSRCLFLSPRLRKAICEWYRRRYGVELDPDSEAIVTIGSKEGLAHLMLACLERGDTVLVPNPSYPIHIYGAIIAGADIRSVRMTPGVDFFAELERAIRELIPKPKMLVIGFPSNPTAKCVERSEER